MKVFLKNTDKIAKFSIPIEDGDDDYLNGAFDNPLD